MSEERLRDLSKRKRWLLREEFSRFADEVLHSQWVLLSAHSRVSDFDSLMPRGELAQRFEETFGVPKSDVLAEPAPLLVDLLARMPTVRIPLTTLIEEELGFRELLPIDSVLKARLVRLMTAIVADCRSAHDLEHRLRSAYESSTKRSERTAFSRWSWLAEDIVARTLLRR